MASREKLQCLLEDLMGNRNVYYNPPENKKLNYPCIVYFLDNVNIDNADDINYIINKRYQITLVDANPISEFVDKLLGIPGIKFNRDFRADGLNHFVFTLYY